MTVLQPSTTFLNHQDSLGRELPAGLLTRVMYHAASFLNIEAGQASFSAIIGDLYYRYALRKSWEEGSVSIETEIVYNRKLVAFGSAMQAYDEGGPALLAKRRRGNQRNGEKH